MNLNIRKTLLLASITMATFGFADMEEKSSQNFNDAYDSVKGKVITPNAGPIVSGGCDFFVSADFIYWYTSTGKDIETTTLTELAEFFANGVHATTIPKGPRSLDPGFKVAAGLDLGYDGWDTLVEYTWLRPKYSRTLTADEHISFGLKQDMQGFAVSYNVYKNHWKFSFNNINWELGRSFFVSPKLVLRPHIGLKGAWQTQSITRNYIDLTGTHIDTLVDRLTGSATSTNKQHYWGFGFRGGLNTSWMFSRNWSLFGNFALSPLWGRFKATSVAHVDLVDTLDVFTLANAKLIDMTETLHQINMIYDFQIGVNFDYYFSNSDYRLRIAAAWEEQVWSDFYQFIGFLTQNAPITFQGLTLKFRFDF